jgi:predicted anti-sigma-YlaC factor YlaD
MTTGPMDCNELVELVTAYLDGSLDLEDRARFDLHLLECDGCENYLQQFRSTVATVGNIPFDEIDPACLPPGLRRDRRPYRRRRGPVRVGAERHHDRDHAHSVCAVCGNP